MSVDATSSTRSNREQLRSFSGKEKELSASVSRSWSRGKSHRLSATAAAPPPAQRLQKSTTITPTNAISLHYPPSPAHTSLTHTTHDDPTFHCFVTSLQTLTRPLFTPAQRLPHGSRTMQKTQMEAGEMEKFCREMFAVPFSRAGQKKLEFAGGPRTARAMIYSKAWLRRKEERTLFNFEQKGGPAKLNSSQKKLVAPLARDASAVERRQDLLEATVACFSDKLRATPDVEALHSNARAGVSAAEKARGAAKSGALVAGKPLKKVEDALHEQLNAKFMRMDEHTRISNSERADIANELVAAEAGRLTRAAGGGSDAPRGTLRAHLATLLAIVGPKPTPRSSAASASGASAVAATPAPKPTPAASASAATKHHQVLGSSISDEVLQCFKNPPAGGDGTVAWLSDDAMRFYGRYLAQYVVPGLDDRAPSPVGGVTSAYFIEGGNLEMFLPAHYQDMAEPREEAMKLMVSWSKEWQLKSRSHIFVGVPDRFFDPHGPYDAEKKGTYEKAISSHWAMLVYDRSALLNETGGKASFHYFDSLHPKNMMAAHMAAKAFWTLENLLDESGESRVEFEDAVRSGSASLFCTPKEKLDQLKKWRQEQSTRSQSLRALFTQSDATFDALSGGGDEKRYVIKNGAPTELETALVYHRDYPTQENTWDCGMYSMVCCEVIIRDGIDALAATLTPDMIREKRDAVPDLIKLLEAHQLAEAAK